MGTDSELRQRRGARGGQKTQDAVTGQVVQGDELVTSGLNTLKNIHDSLSGQVSGQSGAADDRDTVQTVWLRLNIGLSSDQISHSDNTKDLAVNWLENKPNVGECIKKLWFFLIR